MVTREIELTEEDLAELDCMTEVAPQEREIVPESTEAPLLIMKTEEGGLVYQDKYVEIEKCGSDTLEEFASW